MLDNKKATTDLNVDSTSEFLACDGEGSTGGLGCVLWNNKQFIKLPKHYEPSIFSRD